jgi:AcrR family transcriptional regulator
MKTTKERILSEGLTLVAQQGFDGVTLGVLADRTGMSKSGLFAHFGSKEDVQLSLIEETLRVVYEGFVAKAMQRPEGLPRVQALFHGWLSWSERAGLKGGCPIAAGMFERDDLPEGDPIRQKLVEAERNWRHLLLEAVKEAVDRNELKRDLDVAQFVWEMSGIYLSHHVAHRFLKDSKATQRAVKAFERLLEDSAPGKGRKVIARR